MASGWGAGRTVAMFLSAAVCLGGLGWTVVSLQRVKLAGADAAGILSFGPGLLGAVLGGWALSLTVQGLRAQRTPEVIAAELARAVLRAEGPQYRQLLGSGRAAPNGRIDLAFTCSATGISGAQPAGSLESITSYYRQLKPGRVVITGTPDPGATTTRDAGVGKTVLAVALLLGLARKREVGEPVPVRLSAASWPGVELRNWLISYLATTFDFPRRDATQIVEADLVLPIIDGLDEMDGKGVSGYKSRAADLMRAVERFESGGDHCPVVLTCRHAQYQALVDSDAQPRNVAHITISPVDPARAYQYLIQRVAKTPLSRQRWQHILDALDLVASNSPSAQQAHIALARTLDTPWRLTLAATVFQERTGAGNYKRDPSDLLTLATQGRLYEYLLDRYIGAAMAAPRAETDGDTSASIDSSDAPSTKVDARTAWKYLAIIARYLDANIGAGGPRIVAGRALSATDIALHELWPMVGLQLPRRLERTAAAVFSIAICLSFWRSSVDIQNSLWQYFAASFAGFSVLTFVVAGRSWPSPKRIDLQSLRNRSRRHQLIREIALTVKVCIAIGLAYGLYRWLIDGAPLSSSIQLGLKVGLSMGLSLGIMEAFRDRIVVGAERTATSPREVIRGDSTILLIYAALGTAFGVSTAFKYDSIELVALGSAFGIAFGLLAGAGRASLRYLTFLVCSRRQLPWRLGRFLDGAYQLGIMRISGTAWQFRHRELQDHLSVRPLPPPDL